MKTHNTNLSINCDQRINIQNATSLEKAHCCTQAKVVLESNEKKYTLCEDSTREVVITFHELLKRAAESNLQLATSLSSTSIGQLWNQELLGETREIKYITVNGATQWIGEKYLVWSHAYATWLYNANEKIFLQVTPLYPGLFKSNENTPTFKAWLKSYSPVLEIEIPTTTAHTWLRKTGNILNTIEQNIQNEFGK